MITCEFNKSSNNDFFDSSKIPQIKFVTTILAMLITIRERLNLKNNRSKFYLNCFAIAGFSVID